MMSLSHIRLINGVMSY